MEKNSFLIYNDIVYNLYSCQSYDDLRDHFLPLLKLLIPFTYSSIVLADLSADGTDKIFQSVPLCHPSSFTEAESNYIIHCKEDPLLWLIHSKESALIRESDLLPEENRLYSALYKHCYQRYDIFDTLQYSIIYQQQFLGFLTLFRTRVDGIFCEEDMFFLRSLGRHLNMVLKKMIDMENTSRTTSHDPDALAAQYHLTARESQVLQLLFAYRSNEEIAAQLSIRENTLQKHLQNIFRKLNVSSRWELLRM